jgi:hypothetical protein
MSKSSTTTTRGALLRNPHPGEILLEDFLKPMGLSQMDWHAPYMFHRVESTRSCWESGTLRRTPI